MGREVIGAASHGFWGITGMKSQSSLKNVDADVVEGVKEITDNILKMLRRAAS